MSTAALSIAALAISLFAAIASVRATYHVATSGFRASQDFVSDLASLLAALRSIASKGAIVLGEARKTPISIDDELALVRTFMTGTSGLALTLHAGEIGSTALPDEPGARRWRVIRFHFANLGALRIESPGDNQTAARYALDIERTLDTLDPIAVKAIRRRIKGLPTILSSIRDSREQDILIHSLDNVDIELRESSVDKGDLLRRFRAIQVTLRVDGHVDPDVDMFIAVLTNDTRALSDALDRGADPNITDIAVLSRHSNG
jgi:hypothetical protein